MGSNSFPAAWYSTSLSTSIAEAGSGTVVGTGAGAAAGSGTGCLDRPVIMAMNSIVFRLDWWWIKGCPKIYRRN